MKKKNKNKNPPSSLPFLHFPHNLTTIHTFFATQTPEKKKKKVRKKGFLFIFFFEGRTKIPQSLATQTPKHMKLKRRNCVLFLPPSQERTNQYSQLPP